MVNNTQQNYQTFDVWRLPNDLNTFNAKFDTCQTFGTLQAEAFDEPIYGVYNVYNSQHNLQRHENKPQASVWEYT